ncbi:MAG: ClC family H(+)/Cl(-) exchange transporter [Candidatus Rifleibacteriota bacterium]
MEKVKETIKKPVNPLIFLRRRKLALKSIILGIFSGLVAVLFRFSLDKAEHLRESLFVFSENYLSWLPALILTLALILTVYLVTRYVPESSGSGIPHLKGVLKGGLEFRDLRVLIAKFVGGVMAIGSGLALGREGPTVQMGGAAGSILSRLFADNEKERRLLICVGAGAGLSAAFNAPLAGLLFVLEELQAKYDKFSLVSAFAATITGTLVCRSILGQKPVFAFKIVSYPALHLIFWSILLGIVLGFGGLLFNLLLVKSLRKFYRHKFFIAVCLGILIGYLGFKHPHLIGSGHMLIEDMLNSKFTVGMLAMLLIGRFLLTILSYNTGTPGGIFAPLLLLGAIIGAIFYNLVAYVHPGEFDLVIFLVLGMGGMFTAIVRSPLTGIILILEMTNQFFLLLPLMLVSIVAYGIPEAFSNKPIYDELLNIRLDHKKDEAIDQTNLEKSASWR